MPDNTTPVHACRLTVNHIHDADTVFGTVDLGFGLTFTNPHGFRADDYDAWEVDHTRHTLLVTPEEVAKGKAALADLLNLLKTAELWVEYANQAAAVYGRTNVVFWVRPPTGWQRLRDWLVARGYTRPARPPAA